MEILPHLHPEELVQIGADGKPFSTQGTTPSTPSRFAASIASAVTATCAAASRGEMMMTGQFQDGRRKGGVDGPPSRTKTMEGDGLGVGAGK